MRGPRSTVQRLVTRSVTKRLARIDRWEERRLIKARRSHERDLKRLTIRLRVNEMEEARQILSNVRIDPDKITQIGPVSMHVLSSHRIVTAQDLWNARRKLKRLENIGPVRAAALLDWVRSVDASQKARRDILRARRADLERTLRGLPEAHAREIQGIRASAANKRAALE